MGQKRFSWRGRARSFGFAFAGLKHMVATQHNFKIHLVVALIVIISGFALGLSNQDWRWLIMAMGLVLAAETLNTAIELVCDTASPDFHPLIQKSKDVAAGAVLITALAAAVTGVLTFLPYFS
jgi:diacylglycerol kinase (ATP)